MKPVACLVAASALCFLGPSARADVQYNLAFLPTDGSGVSATGSFVLSTAPTPPPFLGYTYEEYRPVYDSPEPGQLLEAIDFYVAGYHFFLDPVAEPFTSVTFYEDWSPGGNPLPLYPYTINYDYEVYNSSGGVVPPSFTFDLDGINYFLDLDLGNGQSLASEGTYAVTGVETVPTPTPEPSTLALLGTGALGVLGALRRRLA